MAMDTTLLAALIGTAGGGLATAGGAWLRARTNVRTAARLIYAELTRDSTAVAYFRRTGHWAEPRLSRSAWDSHSEVLARRRSSASFETVHQGYEALEIAPFIADDSLSPVVRDQWLQGEAERLAVAIREVGDLAQVSRSKVERWTRRLDSSNPRTASRPHPILRTGVISLPLLERLTEDTGLSLEYEGPGVTLAYEGPQPIPGVDTVAEHVVFDARHSTETEDLTAVRWTGRPPTGDPAVDEAYETLVAVTTFMREIYGREVFTHTGHTLAATVHYGKDFNNGWWDGYSLFIGDGDGTVFVRFTRSLEIIAGEACHALTEMRDRFVNYTGEMGALSIALCDVFGSLTKQYKLGQTVEEADWITGNGILAPGVSGVGLHSLKAPGSAYDDETLGKDPQPAHMDDFLHTDRDSGGTHTNSGIPAHAFYRLAASLGGYAWERAGQIWWDALTGEDLTVDPKFADFARATEEAAAARYGDESEEHRAVRDAWSGVGL